jgi:hypothetical protein
VRIKEFSGKTVIVAEAVVHVSEDLVFMKDRLQRVRIVTGCLNPASQNCVRYQVTSMGHFCIEEPAIGFIFDRSGRIAVPLPLSGACRRTPPVAQPRFDFRAPVGTFVADRQCHSPVECPDTKRKKVRSF